MINKSMRKSIHHPLHRTLIDTLIKARKDQNLSQRDIAKKLGVTHSVIGKIETGDRRLDVIEFYEYAKILKLAPSEVLIIIFYNYEIYKQL
jgi:transcriptional regulator with XRE-family HTH domain